MKLPFFGVVSKNLDTRVASYINTPLIKSTSFDTNSGCYQYTSHGQRLRCGGLVNTLEYKYYSHYKDNRSKRRTKKTKIRGSNKKQGKLIDNQLLHRVHVGKTPPRCSKLTTALLDYWKSKGHVLQASQLPVVLLNWNKMTQADVITKHEKTGALCLWEVKTGVPVGGYRKQDNFQGILRDVKCTKYNIWQLQMHYTRAGLIQGGLPIEEANVIQVYSSKDKGTQVKVHKEEEWLKILESKEKVHQPVVL
jgi:hypothetical protein